MNYKSNFSKLLLLIFVVASFLISCQKENAEDESIISATEVSILSKLENSFSLKDFADPVDQIKNNLKIDWHSFTKKEIEGSDWYEFKVSETKPSSISGDAEQDGVETNIKGYNYSMIAIDTENQPKYFVIKIVSFSHQSDYSYFNIQDKKHHGMVYIYNLKGGTEYVEHYQKGILKSRIQNLETDNTITGLVSREAPSCGEQKASTTARCSDALECGLNFGSGSSGGGCGSGGTGGYVTVTTHHYTYWYDIRDSSKELNHIQYNGSSREYVWVSNPRNNVVGAFNYGRVPAEGFDTTGINLSRNKPSGLRDDPNKILLDKSVKLNPCVAAIIKKLGQKEKHLSLVPDIDSQGLSHLSQVILDLFKNSQDYNLFIKIGEAGSNINAHTTAKRKNGQVVFTITLDEEYVTRGSQLAIARTIIHESIHAYLGYVYDTASLSSYSMLLLKYKLDKGRSLGEHEFMTQYTEAMAESLAAWDDHRLDNTNPDYYNHLAWSGELQTNDVYKNLPASIKTKVEDANRAEGNANTSATNNSQSVKC